MTTTNHQWCVYVYIKLCADIFLFSPSSHHFSAAKQPAHTHGSHDSVYLELSISRTLVDFSLELYKIYCGCCKLLRFSWARVGGGTACLTHVTCRRHAFVHSPVVRVAAASPYSRMPHLEVQVIEARKLEAKDINGTTSLSARFHRIYLYIIEYTILQHSQPYVFLAALAILTPKTGKSDPYVKLWIHGQEKQVEKTKKIKETLNPYWDEKFTFKLSEEELKDPWLVVEVYDWYAYYYFPFMLRFVLLFFFFIVLVSCALWLCPYNSCRIIALLFFFFKLF